MNTAKKISKYLWLFLLAAATLLIPMSSVYGSAREPYGFLVTGEHVTGTEGFQKNIVYLTKEELASLKQEKDPQKYGLGDCWISDARYSSYDNHGTGNYHYTIADGLDVLTMLRILAAPEPEFCYIYSSDGYSTKLRLSDMTSLKYFPPVTGQEQLSNAPIFALYETTLAFGDPETAQEPTGPAEMTAAGDETFVYGQRTAKESNHCHFIHGANTLLVGEPVTALKSDSDRYAVLRLHGLLALGTQVKGYTFEDNGQTKEHLVKGVPLWTVLEKLGIAAYIPEGSDSLLEIVSEDGSKTTIGREALEGSMVVWGYADDRPCPAEQTGEMAVYMPQGTKEQAVLYNLKKLNIVDPSGAVRTSAPAPAPPEDPTPEAPLPEEPTPASVSSPKVPASFKAVSAGCQSIRLTWKATGSTDGYYIYRYDTAAKKYRKLKTIKAPASSCTDTGLTTNKNYRYKIRAYVADGQKILLSPASAAASAKPVLSGTTIQKIIKTPSQKIQIKWKKTAGASGYQIYRSVKKNKSYRKTAVVKKSSVTTYIDKTTHAGKTYYYKIRPYRIVNGRYRYGAFSAVQSIKR